jgi:hypothetical protein
MGFRSVLAVSTAALLCACTPMQWVKDDVTPEQLEQDSITCQQDAWREARSRAWYFSSLGPMPFRDPFGRRAFGSPFAPYGDPFGDPYLEEGRLAQFCMRNKGYQLVPAEPGG